MFAKYKKCIKDSIDIEEIKEYVKNISEEIEVIRADVRNTSIVSGGKYTVSEVPFEKSSFLWVCRNGENDFINKCAREGKVFLDPHLLSIFNKKEGVFLDLGGNIGAFSLAFASRGWTGYSFEAGEKNADALELSIKLNDFNVKVEKTIIGDKTQKKYFVENGPWGFVKNEIFKNEKYEELDAICIDDWIKGEKIANIDLIKIDIEGSELSALKGMKKTIEQFNNPPIYTEVNTLALALQGASQFEYFHEAENLGYKVYEIYEGNLYEYSNNLFPLDYCRDYVFLKETPSYMKNRVFGRIANNEGRYDELINKLDNYRNWAGIRKYGDEEEPNQNDVYICNELRWYPEMQTDEVMERLRNIRKEYKEHFLINSFLDWI